MSNEIIDRIAALEADVAHLKQHSISREAVDQLLLYLSRIDGNIANISTDIRQVRTDVSQLNTRVQRLEENSSVLPEISAKVEAIWNDTNRLARAIRTTQ